MNLIPAKNASEENMAQFLKQNRDIDEVALRADGYVTEVDAQLVGCFILEPITERTYMLKQLYMTNTELLKLPALIEAILVLLKDMHASKLFINSHQTMLDIILSALRFYPQSECELLENYPSNNGKWWSYQLV